MFAAINAARALQQETAAELDAMLPAILEKAFKGSDHMGATPNQSAPLTEKAALTDLVTWR
jgi:hypothetical protein